MRSTTSFVSMTALLATLVGAAPGVHAQEGEEPVFEEPVDGTGGEAPMLGDGEMGELGEEPMSDEGAPDEGGESASGGGPRVTGPRGATGAFSEQAAQRADAPNNVVLALSVGGALSYGNSRTFNLTAAANLQLRDGPDVGVLEAAFIYGLTQTPLQCGTVQESDPGDYPPGTEAFCGLEGMGMSRTSRAPGFNDWSNVGLNLQWRARYDHFFDEENALFAAHTGRFDPFAGVVPRLALQVGWNHILFKEGRNHSFAFDLGVDATLDIFGDAIRLQVQRQIDAGSTLPTLWGTDARFMPQLLVRLLYVNRLNDAFTYDTTFEVFWDVVDYTHVRGQWVNHFRSQIDRILQMRVDLTGRFDSQPPGQAVAWQESPTTQTTTMFELVATLNLQGTFDLDGAAPSTGERGEGRGGGGRGGEGGGGGGGGARCAAGASCLRATPARGGGGAGGGGGGGRGGGGGGGGRGGGGGGSGEEGGGEDAGAGEGGEAEGGGTEGDGGDLEYETGGSDEGSD